MDQDLAVRPGDYIRRERLDPEDTSLHEDFQVESACVEPWASVDDNACGGVSLSDFDIASLTWTANHYRISDPWDAPVRCDPVAVAVLIDESGSMAGLVNPGEDYREDAPDQVPHARRGGAPSDCNGPRAEALRGGPGVGRPLECQRRARGFRLPGKATEGAELRTICTRSPEPATGSLQGAPEYFRQAVACLGTDHSVTEDAISLQTSGLEEGRTPLWFAVRSAFEFLTDTRADAARNRHIIVIDDGADTCAETSEEFLDGRASCSDDGYEDTRDLVLAYNESPGAKPVHIHFVQLESKGSPAPDPHQQELACLTDGHYLFLEHFDETEAAGLDEVLEEAMTALRLALSGHWALRVLTPAFQVQEGDVGFLPPEVTLGVSGSVTLCPGRFSEREQKALLGREQSSAAGAWRRFATIRRAE